VNRTSRSCSQNSRQGVLLPGATVFDAFGGLMRVLYVREYEGFVPLVSLDDLGQFARVRMELLKRLCSPKYGIAEPDFQTPISGVVHVYGVSRDGEICEYVKGRETFASFALAEPRPGTPLPSPGPATPAHSARPRRA
jgi:hypothetical protein